MREQPKVITQQPVPKSVAQEVKPAPKEKVVIKRHNEDRLPIEEDGPREFLTREAEIINELKMSGCEIKQFRQTKGLREKLLQIDCK